MKRARQDDSEAVWRALADPTRRRILDLLKQRPRTTGELSEEFDVTRFAVMKHLGVLERAGLVVIRRTGRERWNYLNPVPIQQIYERWMTPYMEVWSHSLLDLKHSVERREDAKRRLRDGRAGNNPAARV